MENLPGFAGGVKQCLWETDHRPSLSYTTQTWGKTATDMLAADFTLPAWRRSHWHQYLSQWETNSKKPRALFPGLDPAVLSRLGTRVWLQCCLSRRVSHKEHFPRVQSCNGNFVLWSKWLWPQQDTKHLSGHTVGHAGCQPPQQTRWAGQTGWECSLPQVFIARLTLLYSDLPNSAEWFLSSHSELFILPCLRCGEEQTPLAGCC